ncbi:MAG: hypothetical protein EOP24_45025 [Hyphomicrobiales bacterium]|nr:MAG: hypothetical protein EOP24_45025 [Hyphomicrobiales bacterium]
MNQLLHAERNRKDVSEVVSNAGAIPQLIVEQAGTSLSEQGLVERRRNNSGYSWEYRLTDAGKALMTEAWKAKHS